MILQLIAQSVLIIMLYMCAGYFIAQFKKDISIVDIMWGLGFIIIAWFSLWKRDLFLSRQLIVTTLITIWGLRLSGYIWWRKKDEDNRYTQLKKHWGGWVSLYTFVFMLQGFFMLLISLSILIINASTIAQLYLLDYLGICLWIVGFSYEVLADWQLYTFLQDQNNKGKILQSGLWSYSRHPNYFGELLLWSGICILAFSIPYGWMAVISPLTLAYIFFFISIPITEKAMESNPAFTEYKEKTNMIIPGFKKRIV